MDISEEDYQKAVVVVRKCLSGSVSNLQRKLYWGYGRAASAIDRMQDEFIVSPMSPSGRRDVYPEETHQLWKELQSAQAVPEGFVLIKASDRDREVCELIDERDHLEDQAEQLKDKLQDIYGVDFGEHSNCNFPFQNAIDFDDSDLVLVKKDHLSEAVEKIELMFEEDSTLALGELLPIQQGIKALIEAQEQKG